MYVWIFNKVCLVWFKECGYLRFRACSFVFGFAFGLESVAFCVWEEDDEESDEVKASHGLWGDPTLPHSYLDCT